jgi:hypothetical protein
MMTHETLTWHQLPRDAGQIVDVTYAVDWESGTLYRRSHDRSDGGQSLEAATIVDGEFQPQNGILPVVSEWVTVEAVYEWTIRTDAGTTTVTAPDADAAAVAWAAGEGAAAVHDLGSLVAHIEGIDGAWLWIESTMAPDGERVYAGRENMP